MSIYLDVSAAVHRRAGLGRYAESLARALVAAHPGRFALFYNRERGVKPLAGLERLPTRTIALGYKPWRMLVWLGQLTRVGFDQYLPDAELFHATEHLLLPLRDVPTVLTVHDLIFRHLPAHHKSLNRWYLNLTMPLYCRRATHIVAVSQHTRCDLMSAYGLPSGKITVIYEAPDPRFRPQPMAEIRRVRGKYSLPEHFILSLGTIEPRKNYRRLIEAFSWLKHEHRSADRGLKTGGWRLVIAGGKGWLYQSFFRRLEELGLGREVILLGRAPDEDLPALYSAAALFVFPSLYEGFGLPPLEAMACGTPVVCSRSSSLPEVGGEAAGYFSPHSPEEMGRIMYKVLTDEALQAEMRKRGFEQAERFSWQRMAEETMDVYRAVIQGH